MKPAGAQFTFIPILSPVHGKNVAAIPWNRAEGCQDPALLVGRGRRRLKSLKRNEINKCGRVSRARDNVLQALMAGHTVREAT